MESQGARFARVAVLAPVRGLFTYRLPEELADRALPGRRVEVPFGNRKLLGFLVDRTATPPADIKARDVLAVLDDGPFFPEPLFRFLLWTADYYLHPQGEVLRTALPPGAGEPPEPPARARRAKGAVKAILAEPRTRTLTPAQLAVCAPILQAIDASTFAPFLLHGVTGSGKTEIYLAAIAQALERGRGAVILVPEIGLTPQLVLRFRERFGDSVAVLHSGTGRGERGREWRRLRDGSARVAVGVRAAVFAPVPAMGLIVVDEEHDPSFKQEDRLCYHARDMAVARAKIEGCVVLLGSATPSLESYANAEAGRYRRLSLPDRIDDRPLPPVDLVDLRGAPRVDLLREALREALSRTLDRREQAILFLNRRGHSGSLSCQGCGHVAGCPDCSVALTHHLARKRLLCHYCGHSKPVPVACPVCRGPLTPLGAGTERVEEEVAHLFPDARLARLDGDTGTPAKVAQTLAAFADRKLDILIGTQVVAKGHDFPGVTLVGVILADTGLRLPDFRAAERSFQLLVQVAGRAGRGAEAGRVLIQTFSPEHPALRHAAGHDYLAFVRDELARRRALGWPPYGRLCAVRVDAVSAEAAEGAARRLGHLAERFMRAQRFHGALLGPAPAPLERLRGRTRWQLLLRAASAAQLRRLAVALLSASTEERGPVRVVFDMDPVSML